MNSGSLCFSPGRMSGSGGERLLLATHLAKATGTWYLNTHRPREYHSDRRPVILRHEATQNNGAAFLFRVHLVSGSPESPPASSILFVSLCQPRRTFWRTHDGTRISPQLCSNGSGSSWARLQNHWHVSSFLLITFPF